MATESDPRDQLPLRPPDLGALPLHEPILVATFVVVALGGLALVAALTYFRLWGYLWREWFTSVDHKKIGIMYMILGLIMLLRGFADAIMMRAAAGRSPSAAPRATCRRTTTTRSSPPTA